MQRFPKKLLRITDLTFILPDDFDGELKDALSTLSEYVATHNVDKKEDDNRSSTIASLLEGNNEDSRICMNYGIFESDEDGNYILK